MTNNIWDSKTYGVVIATFSVICSVENQNGGIKFNFIFRNTVLFAYNFSLRRSKPWKICAKRSVYRWSFSLFTVSRIWYNTSFTH